MSHGGLLGTSRPCHYQVLIDENKMSPDVLQQLTYNLAYIYPRSTRSVSIVSPAYFAHHVATRARAHIGGDIDDDQSMIFSELSSGREAAIRDQKLQGARDKLRNIHVNLENSMYFMVSNLRIPRLQLTRLIKNSLLVIERCFYCICNARLTVACSTCRKTR
jgi:eukaryotic translation initiation factor 2C